MIPWDDLTGRIAYSIRNQIFIIDSHTRTVRAFPPETFGNQRFFNPSRMSFAPDGRRLAVEWWVDEYAVPGQAPTSFWRETRIYNVTTGLPVDTVRGFCGQWLNDGRFMYIGTNGTFYINGFELGTIDNHECPSISSDGEFAIYAARQSAQSPNPRMMRYDFRSAMITLLPTNEISFLSLPAVSPDKSMVAYQYAPPGDLHSVRLNLMTPAGTNVRVATPFWPMTYYMVWSPDSRKILWSIGDILTVHDVQTGQTRPLVQATRELYPRYGWGP